MGTNHNYIHVIVNDSIRKRIQTTGNSNRILIVEGLPYGLHNVVICKDTEGSIGYLELEAIICQELIKSNTLPKLKFEFIGNSITCGTGSDLSVVNCGEGEWYQQHNAWDSYGAITARKLNAQWHLSSVSGIGMIHSCCDMDITLPDVFDNIDLSSNESGKWNFNQYIPNIVTICLGQNDGVQDSAKFCKAYINFIQTIRTAYPQAHIICLTSPMADENLTPVLKNYLTGVVDFFNNDGISNVHKYFFSKSYISGCDSHPSKNEHYLIAQELIEYVVENFDEFK
jgi:hypothetical protein